MSELRADTITASDGTSPVTLTKQSAAKAWANITGTGTAIINDSVNHSSLTDNTTGDYTLSLTSSMDNTSYSFAYTGKRSSSSDLIFVSQQYATPLAVGSYRPRSFHFTNTASPVGEDADKIGTTIHGDLA